MISEDIIDQIEELRCHTNTNISNLSIGNVPTVTDFSLSRIYSYTLDGDYVSMDTDNSMTFIAKIPYTGYMENTSNTTYRRGMIDLVNSQEVFPFFIFINHKFIKWSDIEIVKDVKYSYIIINGCRYVDPFITTVLIPTNDIEYAEDVISKDKKFTFAFNENSEYATSIEDNHKYTTLLINDKNIYCEKDQIEANVPFQLKMTPDKKILLDNIFVFKDGKIIDNSNIIMTGLNILKVNDTPLHETNRYCNYIAFKQINANVNVDNDLTVRNKKELVKKIVDTHIVPKFFKKLSEKFDFQYDRKKKYNENVAYALLYIMNYNSQLLSNAFKKRSNIIVLDYTGSEIKKKAKENGIVTMSRKIDEFINNYIMIFKNGFLFEDYKLLDYDHKDFSFPVNNIQDDDEIEIIYFKNIDNDPIKTIFYSNSDDIVTIDPDIDLSLSSFYSTDPAHPSYNIKRNENLQYKVDFYFEKLSNDKAKMYPIDPFYYDRELSLISNRQFNYNYEIVESETNKIDLDSTFRFCTDENKYIVFLNHRKLNSNSFRVTTPKETRPFDQMAIYIDRHLEKGDILEVFYAGDDLEEVYYNDELNLSGTIVIDKSNIHFALDKDLYFVFVNGRLVSRNNIINIDSKRLQIKTPLDRIYNVSILRYIPNDKVISTIFDKGNDILSSIYDNIDNQTMDELFKESDMENTEDNMNQENISVKELLMSIIKRFWLRPGINTGSSMIYDYDDTDLEKDENGDIIIK